MRYLLIIFLLLVPSPTSGQPEPGAMYTLRCLTEYPERRDEFREIMRLVKKVGPNYRYKINNGVLKVYYPDRGWLTVRRGI